MEISKIDFNKLNKKLVFEQDCTLEVTNGNYFEIGKTKIVNSPIGSYREASKTPHSRFGYRFTLKNKQKPHLFAVELPDNEKRFICIQNGTTYDNTTAVILGGTHKLSNKMKTIYNIYWPRWTDDSIVFTSYALPNESPAAIKAFKVYELESLPQAKLPKDCLKKNNRTFGVQYEDPCNVGNTEGAFEYFKWIERHIEFMKMVGQNHLIYPINWYHGPIVPVKSQPNSRFNTLCMEDRKSYIRSTFKYQDWLEDLLNKFDKENLHFTGSLTLMRLGGLFEKWNIDKKAIEQGADTINNMLFDGSVQTAINDWTTIYNPLNFEKWANIKDNAYTPFEEYAYGEKKTNTHKTPLFNALHPEVERQLVTYFEELGERYGKHESLDGFQINFWHGTMLWYANLLCGYDDYSFTLFEKETGINSNIDIKDKNRFEKRYEFMIKNCKDKFVAWRTKKIYNLIIKLRDALRRKSVRKNLNLTLCIWNETSYPAHLHSTAYQQDITEQMKQYGNRCSNYELYREGGLDIELFKNVEGIKVCVEHSSARGRDKESESLELARYLEDYHYLDSELNEKLKNAKNSVGFHFDCWVELWGNHKKFNVEKNDKNIETITSFKDYKPDFIFHENSYYDDDKGDKFFFDWQLRIASPYGIGNAFLEEMTMDLAIHDALSFTSGGLYLDKAHAQIQLEFAKEFRKLPAVKFKDVKSVGAVTSRYYFDGTNTIIYAVNREPFNNKVTIDLGDRVITKNIAPFMLKVIKIKGKIKPKKVVAKLSKAVVKKYEIETKQVIKILNNCNKAENPEKGVNFIKNRIILALKEEKYHELRHLLNCYVVLKAKSTI